MGLSVRILCRKQAGDVFPWDTSRLPQHLRRFPHLAHESPAGRPNPQHFLPGGIHGTRQAFHSHLGKLGPDGHPLPTAADEARNASIAAGPYNLPLGRGFLKQVVHFTERNPPGFRRLPRTKDCPLPTLKTQQAIERAHPQRTIRSWQQGVDVV